MGALLRLAEVPKRPVVTTAGEDVAQVRDVVYDSASGRLLGFTLAGRGMFSGPRKESLAWADVVGFGPDAVIIEHQDVLVRQELREQVDERDVLGARVVTDDGRVVGEVTDIIVRVDGREADVVGYELEPADGFEASSRHILLPLPDTLAATGDNLVVPAAAVEYVRSDMAGFGAAVEDLRAALHRSDREDPS